MKNYHQGRSPISSQTFRDVVLFSQRRPPEVRRPSAGTGFPSPVRLLTVPGPAEGPWKPRTAQHLHGGVARSPAGPRRRWSSPPAGEDEGDAPLEAATARGSVRPRGSERSPPQDRIHPGVRPGQNLEARLAVVTRRALEAQKRTKKREAVVAPDIRSRGYFF